MNPVRLVTSKLDIVRPIHPAISPPPARRIVGNTHQRRYRIPLNACHTIPKVSGARCAVMVHLRVDSEKRMTKRMHIAFVGV